MRTKPPPPPPPTPCRCPKPPLLLPLLLLLLLLLHESQPVDPEFANSRFVIALELHAGDRDALLLFSISIFIFSAVSLFCGIVISVRDPGRD
jgi:hypothetical protein